METATTPVSPQVQDAGITVVGPDLLAAWLASGDAALVDVREDYEHAEERIEGAALAPLSTFDAEVVRRAHPGKRVVFHCRSGKRSAQAAAQFRRPDEPAFHLAGGIEAWKAAGMPVLKPTGGPRIGIMRQVQIVAGGLVLIGVGLGLVVSPWFLGIAAFVGAGLAFAGITGWCGMAMALSRMPWNGVHAPTQPTNGSCSR